MKAILLVTGSGPLLIVTSYASATDPKLVEGLRQKGIERSLSRSNFLSTGLGSVTAAISRWWSRGAPRTFASSIWTDGRPFTCSGSRSLALRFSTTVVWGTTDPRDRGPLRSLLFVGERGHDQMPYRPTSVRACPQL